MNFLTSQERHQIEQKRGEVRSKKEHVRLSVLIMLDEGFSHDVIALCLSIHTDTVSNLKQKYASLSGDLNGYLSDNYVAFEGYLSGPQLAQLDAQLQEKLYLNSRQIGDYLYEEFNPDYSDAGVTAIPHRLG